MFFCYAAKTDLRRRNIAELRVIMQLKHWLIMVFFVTNWGAAQQWQKVTTQSDIQISKRIHSGGVFEVNAQVELCTTISAFIGLLHDTNAAPQWIHHAQRVALISSSETAPLPLIDVVHTYFDPPWPARKRDMITRSEITQNADTLELVIRIEDLGQTQSADADYVRMTNIQGVWRLTPLQNGRIKITYSGSGDPSGMIPNWLANKLLVSSTRQTFEKLAAILPTPTYQEYRLTSINEPQGCVE